MKHTRPVLAVAAVLALGLSASSASSATKPPAPKAVKILDMASDANAINAQGQKDPDGKPLPIPAGTATAVQVAGADIRSVSYVTTVEVKKVGKKLVNVPTGMAVTMTLAAPPQANAIFRATAVTGACSTFFLQYQTTVDAKGSSLRHNCTGFRKALPTSTSETLAVDSFAVSGSTITWKLLAGKSLPSAITAGTKFTDLGGHSRFYAGTAASGGATAPEFDGASGPAPYTYGQ